MKRHLYLVMLAIFLISFLFPSCAATAEKCADYYYPPLSGDTWEKVSPASLGWNEAKLSELATYLSEKRSTGFIILHKGKIAYEKYFGSFGLHDRGTIASAGKSMTSFVIGVAQERGLLNINDPVSKYLNPGWTNRVPAEKEALITVRHLLTMTSGLNEGLTYYVDAGTRWFYNTPAYWKLYNVMVAASGKNATDFTKETLWDPIGMQDAVYYSSQLGGKEVSGDTLPNTTSCSVRDMARFGLMVLSNGKWAGKDVIKDKEFLKASVNTSQQLNLSYGYLWWLNGKDSFILPGVSGKVETGTLVQDAPKDMFSALGAGDKKIYVVPSLDLVVCRHGEAAGETVGALSSFDNQIWIKLMAAIKK